MSVASVKGASYYVTSIDDFSKKSWIYFMKTKDEVFSRFRAFKSQVGVSTPLQSSLIYAKEARIKREKIVAYYHQQNGVVEMKNRSIISAVKAMLHDQSLPMYM
jgi:hypothetical protein